MQQIVVQTFPQPYEPPGVRCVAVAYFNPKYSFDSKGLQISFGTTKAEAIGNLILAHADADDLIDITAAKAEAVEADA